LLVPFDKQSANRSPDIPGLKAQGFTAAFR
jgi:hypothetical protein